jgi:23S rRNA (adenine2030-N6)-methyltransferase
MNYHHIYHAGNFADIFKHVILVLCLEKLHEKPTSFFAIDTHAGLGKYDLADEKSLRTSEFIGHENFKKIQRFLPERYLKILAKINRCEIYELSEKMKIYAGSPAIIRDYLRKEDHAIFAELNRDDFSQLRRNFAGSDKFSFVNSDGFALLKSKLPPLEKRGIILIDPAFEKDQSKVSTDYEKIISSLEEGYKRFAHGIYLIWHPIIESDEATLNKFYGKISQLKFEKKIHATFDIGAKTEDTKMHSCGMFIFNAPWQLEEKLNEIMPKILEVLQQEKNAKFSIKQL